MKSREIPIKDSPDKTFSLMPEPALAWTAILSLGLITTLGIFLGAGKALNLLFPLGAFAVGLLLYLRYPILYLSFTWWMWFLTAFVRRLADYYSGSYTEPSPMLIAPYLVTVISAIALLKNLPKIDLQSNLPFLLCFSGVIYGFLVGLIAQPSVSVIIGVLDWLVPIALGFHLHLDWRNYPAYRRNLQRTFIWAVLLMGTYGIFQYIMTPQWDLSWLDKSGLITANGYPGQTPGPFAIRVFATMQSIEPFGSIMAVGLLLLFDIPGTLRLPAAVVGYLAFLLTLMRSAWVGWLAGLLTLIGSMQPKFQIRLVSTILIMSLCLFPLLTLEPFSATVDSRVQSLTNVGEDKSASGRVEHFQDAIVPAITSFAGKGIQNGSQDNTILALFLYLGWMGTLPYLAGLTLLVLRLFHDPERSFDPFIGSARAITISLLVRLPVNGVIMESSGVALWCFLALGLAAKKYSRHQRELDFVERKII